jgi:cytochrome c
MQFPLIGTVALAMTTLFATAVWAAGDVSRGKEIFQRTCINCHSTEIGVNKIGPSLHGVVGREVAIVPDFIYSDALKATRKTWTEAELDAYLADPRGAMHGVKMFFKGLPDADQRVDVIAYLKTLN